MAGLADSHGAQYPEASDGCFVARAPAAEHPAAAPAVVAPLVQREAGAASRARGGARVPHPVVTAAPSRLAHGPAEYLPD